MIKIKLQIMDQKTPPANFCPSLLAFFLSRFSPVASRLCPSHLQKKLERARSRLQTLWDAKGHTDAEVLAAGAEFDRLLNEYRRTGERREAKVK